MVSEIEALGFGTEICGNNDAAAISVTAMLSIRLVTPELFCPAITFTLRPLRVAPSSVTSFVAYVLAVASAPTPLEIVLTTNRSELGRSPESARVVKSRSPVWFSNVAPVTLIIEFA